VKVKPGYQNHTLKVRQPETHKRFRERFLTAN
jgi:hypothetical protein